MPRKMNLTGEALLSVHLGNMYVYDNRTDPNRYPQTLMMTRELAAALICIPSLLRLPFHPKVPDFASGLQFQW